MLPQLPLSRLMSLANASSIVRTGSSSLRTFTARSAGTRNMSFNGSRISQPNLAAKLNSSFSSPLISAARVSFLTPRTTFEGQTFRGFSQRVGLFSKQTSVSASPIRSSRLSQQLQKNNRRSYSSHHPRKRRPFRFLFKIMVVSSAIVALPAIIVLGAPIASLFVIPLAVGGIVGGALLLTGGILFFAIPMAVVGGAIALYVFSMPAAVAFKDMNGILKRDKKDHYETALAALGPDWEIQSSGPQEWFRWTFPQNQSDLDKVSIRMAVFDPNDISERKARAFRWLDNIETRTHENEIVYDEDEETKVIKKKVKKNRGHFEMTNNSDSFEIEHLEVKREGDHILIEIEDHGDRFMKQKLSKKYLELARIVDRAATEMEAAHPGMKLGDQVVLVHRLDKGSFWNQFSFYGDIALRVPVDRQWVKDLSDL
ncbi:hypothetical protein BGZ83_003198 [Gryganskiella cystojenkinii]|nr:hypothetical protein BGZ83_003198 [Gryganskiella cystojenkinii]